MTPSHPATANYREINILKEKGFFWWAYSARGRRKRGDYFSKDIYFKYASFTFGSDTVSEKALVHSKYNVW